MLTYVHKPIKNEKGNKKKGITKMDSKQTDIEQVTMSEVLELATWDRPRTNEELQNFISTREAAIAGK